MVRNSNCHFTALALGLASAWACLAAGPLRADQFAVEVDRHGHQVFINAGESAKRPRRAPAFGPVRISRVPTPEINKLVESTASKFRLDPELVHAVIQAESEYNPRAVSRKGAIGLMQLIPDTAARLGVSDPFDPKQNIEGGVGHLKYLMDVFGGNLALSLAAYNSGTKSVLRYGGVPPFTETRNYVRKVWDLYRPGSTPDPKSHGWKLFIKEPIHRFVDAQGVVHYSNVE